MELDIPYPYRFNPWKHHKQWVCQQLVNLKDKEQILDNVCCINSNQVDIYTGLFSPEEITANIDFELKRNKAFQKADFTSWLHQEEFRLISLKDNSVWVIREGLEDDRYIHFHPARNSPNCIRLHGNSWKTAVVIKLLYPNLSDLSLQLINEIRQSNLGLSPVKGLKGSSRIYKTLEILQ